MIALATIALAALGQGGPSELPVKEVAFKSAALDREMRYNVILPVGYETSGARYPVLYLLHGLMSNYKHWAYMGVRRFAVSSPFVVVMADAGNSWYVNWAKSDEGRKNAFEDYLVQDLIGHVDATYRTIAKREGRAISGLSMGGYGALTVGLRHPQLFAAVGSQSGAVGFAKGIGEMIKRGDLPNGRRRVPRENPLMNAGVPGFSTQEERTPKGTIFETVEQCEAHDPFKLVLKVPKAELPFLYVDCGTEDNLISGNRELLKLMTDNNVPFTFAQSPGLHLPAYWAREVGRLMAVFAQVVARPEPGPKAPAVEEVRALIERQAADWNKKDLDAFLTGYWDSPDLVFQSGGDRTRGLAATKDRYQKRYAAEGKEMGALTFSDLEIEELVPDRALARGRWGLTFAEGKTAGGLFTLDLRRFAEGWKIVSDHTSSAD